MRQFHYLIMTTQEDKYTLYIYRNHQRIARYDYNTIKLCLQAYEALENAAKMKAAR